MDPENEDRANPTFEDLMHNGAYCDHGLAFPDPEDQYAAKCSMVDKVLYDGEEIKSPYKCNPNDNEKWCVY